MKQHLRKSSPPSNSQTSKIRLNLHPAELDIPQKTTDTKVMEQPPLFTRFKNRIQLFLDRHQVNKQLLITLALLLLLPFTIGAALTVQNLKQKAAEYSHAYIISFTDASGNPLPDKISDPNVYLQIRIPPDWKLPTQSRKNSVIQQAYAQDALPAGICAAPDGRTCTQESCGGETNVGNCTLGCPLGYTWCRGGFCVGSCPAPTQPPAQPTATPASACIRGKFYADSCARCATDGSFLGTPGSDFGDDPAGSPIWCACAKTHKPEYYQQYCGTSSPTSMLSPTPTAIPMQVSPQPTESIQSPTPGINILKEIRIENMDDYARTVGNTFSATSNFEAYINKPIPWRLEELKPNETEARRFTRITLTGTMNSVGASATITLSRPIISPTPSTVSNEYLVDVFIAKSFKRPNEVEQWLKKIIDSYINSKFQEAGIKWRVKVDKTIFIDIDDDSSICERAGGKGVNFYTCTFDDNKIHVFVAAKDIGTFSSLPFKILISLPNFPGTSFPLWKDENALTHEFGHTMGLPDYGSQSVSAENNEVVPIGFIGSINDIMNVPSSGFFSELSAKISNAANLPIDTSIHWRKLTPKQTILKIVDDADSPIIGAKIEVFPQVLQWQNFSIYPLLKIPNVVSFEGTTNEKGEFSLGNEDNLLRHKKIQNAIKGSTALLRITYQDKVRYMSVDVSTLNGLYFYRGAIETGTIKRSFSSLWSTQTRTQSVNPLLSPELKQYQIKHFYEELKGGKEEQKMLDHPLQQHLQQEQGNNQQATSSTPILTASPQLSKSPPCYGKYGNNTFGYGDIDGDGVLTQTDYDLIRTAYNGAISLTPEQQARAHLDGQTVLTSGDVGLLGEYLGGKITTFPVCSKAN